MIKKTLSVLFLGASLVSSYSYAQFRCQGKLIGVGGYSKLDVKRYCGEPLMKDSYSKPEVIKNGFKKIRANCSSVDQWYYTYGPEKITYVVEFERGFVTRVVRGENRP